MRPRAWISNFPEGPERVAAAVLLDYFVFFSERATKRLFIGAFESVLRMPASRRGALTSSMFDDAVFTPVLGEEQRPNPTDSGYAMTKTARQALSIGEDRFLSLDSALEAAVAGKLVVFLDDVTLTGSQFLGTWKRPVSGSSFADRAKSQSLLVVYVCVCATLAAKQRIEREAPNVSICATHMLDDSATYKFIPQRQPPPFIQNPLPAIESLLDKYSPNLTFRKDDQYMLKEASWRRNGFKDRRLLIGFEHNMPDGTLPIFWADGPDDWTPLMRRT